MQTSFFELPSIVDYALQSDRIDIWQFSLEKLPENAWQLLNDPEKERAKRFYFEKHRRRFVITRALLRKILSCYLQQNPRDIDFCYNRYGKPFLFKQQALEFNVTHSQDLAFIAIGQSHALGIDIEFFSCRPYKGIANQLFSSTELAHLHQQAERSMPLCFFDIWSQKEAFIKRAGMGLSYPTQTFTTQAFTSNYLINDPLHHATWRMQSFMPRVACFAALCHHPAIAQFRKRTLDPALFLADCVLE